MEIRKQSDYKTGYSRGLFDNPERVEPQRRLGIPANLVGGPLDGGIIETPFHLISEMPQEISLVLHNGRKVTYIHGDDKVTEYSTLSMYLITGKVQDEE